MAVRCGMDGSQMIRPEKVARLGYLLVNLLTAPLVPTRRLVQMLRGEACRSGTLSLMLLGFCMCLTMFAGCRSGTKSSTSDAGLTSSEPIGIAPGTTSRRELIGGAKEVFSLSADPGQLLRFSIDKGDLLLATTVYGPTGVKLLEHVSQDFEIVELSFPCQLAGAYTIEIRSQESAQTPRQYELKVQPLTPVTELSLKDSEARQAMANAEVLRAKTLAASYREAAEQFDKAALIWTSNSDFANAARAALKSGDVYFLLSDYKESSKRSQYVEEIAEKSGDWLAKAKALSQMGLSQSYLGNNDVAQKQLNQALDLFKQHQADRDVIATNAYGEALTNLAEVSYSIGDFTRSKQQLENALKVFRNHRKGEARAHLVLGFITGSIGKVDTAAAELTKAEDLYRSINDKIGETRARLIPEEGESQGNENRPSEMYFKAVDTFHSAGDRMDEATALNALGASYERLGQHRLAIIQYQTALQIYQDIGLAEAVSVSTLQIAMSYAADENFDQARAYYERCLTLTRSVGNVRDEMNALSGIAKVYAAQGLHKQAAELFPKVLKFYESIGDLRGRAMTLNDYGESLLQLEDKLSALDTYRRALPFSEHVGEPGVLIKTLYGLARARLELGFPEAALPFIQRSLNIIEDLRANVQSPEFRVSYFEGVQPHYELCIRVLMQLETLKPGQGFAAEAFRVSERGRARLLVDLVTESRSRIRTGVDAHLLERERRIRESIRLQAAYKVDLLSKKSDKAEIAEVDNNVVQLRAQYQEVMAELSRRQPRLFSIEQAPPLDLQRIQRELGSDTMLLEYSLGETSSYVWAVTSDSFKFYELPAGKTIEDAVREYYQSVTARQGTGSQNYEASVTAADKLLEEKTTHLGQLLFGPVAGQFGNKRLLVVAEGALQYIPLDALRVPGGPLLLETNEVVVLPSISTLMAIRDKINRSASPRKLVAVIADPVFSSSDGRVQTKTDLPEETKLNRLIHASEEADAITGVAPWGTTLVAKGFDATRETAMSSDFGQYQIVHFATHAFPDDKHPELSSVVLTLVNRDSQRADGLMPLPDIYSLDLSAELTVLSACQTALGKDIKGEGLVGLTHGFLSAGSNTVVASLWNVDDRATAIFMGHFYKAMLQEDMPPAAALRSAKLKMMRDKDWGAPYYWAGFVVQGEYRNHIAIDHQSSLRFGFMLLFLLGLIAAGLLILRKRNRRFSAPQSS
jgi:CHAT domain-containing protein/tetratricopeptide (TPR) repeat protein